MADMIKLMTRVRQFCSLIAKEEEAKKAAASGKNLRRVFRLQPNLSLSEIPSFPATTERWGEIVKGQAKMKANGGLDKIDDEGKAILYSLIAKEEEAKKAAASGKNLRRVFRLQPNLSLSEIPSFPATTKRWGEIVKGQAKMKANGGLDKIDDEGKAILYSLIAKEEEAKKAAASGKNLRRVFRLQPNLSLSEIPSFPATTKRWGEIVKGQAKMKANGGLDKIDDEGKAIFYSLIAKEEEAKKAAASGKNLRRVFRLQPNLSLCEIPSFPATTKRWGEIVKGQAKMKANGGLDKIDDEGKAILYSLIAKEEEAKKAAASGKNLRRVFRLQPNLSLSEIPSFPATTECWGEIVKGQAKMKANGGLDKIDDEGKAILYSLIAKEEEAKKAAASGKNLRRVFRLQPNLSLSEIPSFPTTTERWGEIVKGQAKMKANGGHDKIDDEGKAILYSLIAKEEEAKKAAVSGKKRPTESASKTPATEKKAKLISSAGQKTGGSERKGAHTATPHLAKTGKTPANSDDSKQQTPKSSAYF
ncbi:histone deacetylase HDT2-like [Iris pallida]|uniref:Histone deacetylase HDT2-like n=1 Tax=Iris pallida TaxID=29817 RepID=A0AAX6HC24_IRIPA|nr:histone deacetylase HDT2-like [Iris pallida]